MGDHLREIIVEGKIILMWILKKILRSYGVYYVAEKNEHYFIFCECVTEI
jgi:hypothetical protein